MSSGRYGDAAPFASHCGRTEKIEAAGRIDIYYGSVHECRVGLRARRPHPNQKAGAVPMQSFLYTLEDDDVIVRISSGDEAVWRKKSSELQDASALLSSSEQHKDSLMGMASSE